MHPAPIETIFESEHEDSWGIKKVRVESVLKSGGTDRHREIEFRCVYQRVQHFHTATYSPSYHQTRAEALDAAQMWMNATVMEQE